MAEGQRGSLARPLLGGGGPKKEGPPRHGTPWSSTVNLAATAMGTGVLTLPYAFARCGPMRCLIVLAVLATTTDMTLTLLVRTGRATNSYSFGAIMSRLFGNVGSLVFQVLMISVLFLALTAMQRVVLDLLPMLLEEVLSLGRGSLKPVTVGLGINVGVFLACFSKSVHGLRFTSGAALACLAPFVLALLWKACAAALDAEAEAPVPLSESVSLDGLLLAAPLLASALCCHFSILDIDREMDPRHKDAIYGVIHTCALGVLPATYVIVSMAGVSLFGGATPDNILTEFHADKAMSLARGVLSLTNALRMPLIVLPLHSLLCDVPRNLAALLGGGTPLARACSRGAKAFEENGWMGILVLLVASVNLAFRMKALTRVMGLLGGTGGVLGCFCLPGLMYLALPRAGLPTSRGLSAVAVASLVIGALVATAGALTWS